MTVGVNRETSPFSLAANLHMLHLPSFCLVSVSYVFEWLHVFWCYVGRQQSIALVWTVKKVESSSSCALCWLQPSFVDWSPGVAAQHRYCAPPCVHEPQCGKVYSECFYSFHELCQIYPFADQSNYRKVRALLVPSGVLFVK